jgi:hypothetical protein
MKHGLFSSRAQPQAPPMWVAHVMTQILSRLDEADMMSWVMSRVICGWRCGTRLVMREGWDWLMSYV